MKTVQLIIVALIAGLAGFLLNDRVSDKEIEKEIEVATCEITAACCPETEYCGIKKDSLLTYMANYRDSIWSKTSPYFWNNPYDKKILIGPNPPSDPYDFDSRYMDVDIEYLKNYICRIKTSSDPALKKSNTIRMYYIRYDDKNPIVPDPTSVYNIDYRRKHSIALVPAYVKTDDKGGIVEIKEFTEDEGGMTTIAMAPGPHCETGSVYANYNQLCPPLVDCGDVKQTLIFEADDNY